MYLRAKLQRTLKQKKHDKDKDDTPEKKCSHSEDDEEENTDGSFTQTAKSPGKEKNVKKTNMPALKKDASALKMMKKTL